MAVDDDDHGVKVEDEDEDEGMVADAQLCRAGPRGCLVARRLPNGTQVWRVERARMFGTPPLSAAFHVSGATAVTPPAAPSRTAWIKHGYGGGLKPARHEPRADHRRMRFYCQIRNIRQAIGSAIGGGIKISA